MGNPKQVIHDPVTDLEQQDKLWVAGMVQLIKESAEAILDAAAGDVTIIDAATHARCIADFARKLEPVVAGIEPSPWHDEVPKSALAVEMKFRPQQFDKILECLPRARRENGQRGFVLPSLHATQTLGRAGQLPGTSELK